MLVGAEDAGMGPGLSDGLAGEGTRSSMVQGSQLEFGPGHTSGAGAGD